MEILLPRCNEVFINMHWPARRDSPFEVTFWAPHLDLFLKVFVILLLGQFQKCIKFRDVEFDYKYHEGQNNCVMHSVRLRCHVAL